MASKNLAHQTDAVRVELAAPTIVLNQPRPVLATPRNCVAVLGLEPRAFLKIVRLMIATGLPSVTTSDGPAIKVVDLEDFVSKSTSTANPAPFPAATEEDEDEALLASAGLRLTPTKKRASR